MSTVSPPAPVPAEAGRPRAAPAAGEAAASPAVDDLATLLAGNLARGVGGAITWLNHYSALTALEAEVPLEEFDYLGLDGMLLCRLLGVEVAASRTSADLLLPALLERAEDLRVALVGSTAATLDLVADKIESRYGHRVVLKRDGYDGLPEVPALRRQLRTARAQLAILGLGTPLQDFYALGLKQPGVLVATCGGWLDQFSGETYYPAWAYPLRLNWLVRLSREPRRLWRRYSVDAVRAMRSREDLVDYVTLRGARPLAATTPSASAPSTTHLPAA